VSTIVGNSVSLLTPSQLKDTQMIQLIGKQTTMTATTDVALFPVCAHSSSYFSVSVSAKILLNCQW